MSNGYDVVIVGAGGFGTSSARALAAAGASVLVLDRYGIGSQTASRAAGLTAVGRGPRVFSELSRSSLGELDALADESGKPVRWVRSGSLLVARTSDGTRHLRSLAATTSELGVQTQLLDAADAVRSNPLLSGGAVAAALHTPEDAYFEPADLPAAFAAAARRRGAELRSGQPVIGLLRSGDSVRGVITPDGPVPADVVIDTAGAWSGRVAATAGLDVPLVPVRHQLLITAPLADVRPSQPVIRVLESHVYVRPCWGGLMLGGYEADPRWLEGDDLADDLDVAGLELDASVVRRFGEQVADLLPVLPAAPARLVRGGVPSMTADGLPLLGRLPGVDGLVVAAGCSVAGLSIAAAAGRCVAALLTGERPPVDVSALDPARFAGQDPQQLRAAARAQYTTRYRPADATHASGSDRV